MNIINGICYASDSTPPIHIIEAVPAANGSILVTFNNGEKRLFHNHILTGSAFAPLKNPAVFQQCSVFHGFLTWLDGKIDIAPETVYANSIVFTDSDN